jgi:hypothetical protein
MGRPPLHGKFHQIFYFFYLTLPLTNSKEGKSGAKCDKTFSRNFELEIHVVKIHGHVKYHSCEICGKRFFIKWILKKH